MLRRTRLCKMTKMCLRREVRLLSSCTITSLNLNKCTQGWRGGLRIWGGFPRSKKAKKLPGRIARRERARKCHWLKNCVGVASRRCYLRLCSIVPSVFQLVWDTSVIPPTLTRLHFKKQQQQKNLGYISKSVYKDVFFLQPVLGRQLSSVSSGGQALQPAVLGQPAAEAERVEGEQSESHS